MKITAVKTFPFSAGWRDILLVKLETDEGLFGWGEAGLLGRIRASEASVRELETYLLGKDPCQIELHWNNIYRNSYWRPSVTLLSALAGVEMAMWDILGKSLNAPVYKLLGGAYHSRVKVYDNAWWVGTKSIEELAKRAQQSVASGFRHLKWDPWWWEDSGVDIFIDRQQARRARESVKMIREAVGDDVELLLEMHGRFSPDDAIRTARDLEEFRPYFIEEPIPPHSSVDALARVKANTEIPVAAGERFHTRWGFWEVLDKQAVSIVQPDLIYCGGILETKKIAAMAQVFYIGVAPHISEGPINVAALVHVDASTPNFQIQEFFYPDLANYDKILTEPFPYPKDGFIELPTRPGLGVEVDEIALTRELFEYRPGLDLGVFWRGGIGDFGKPEKQ
jgi:galactonate dehydratase